MTNITLTSHNGVVIAEQHDLTTNKLNRVIISPEMWDKMKDELERHVYIARQQVIRMDNIRLIRESLLFDAKQETIAKVATLFKLELQDATDLFNALTEKE